MKISIVTIYDAYNYGCFLQAFSTYTVLKELEYDVSMLDCFDTSYKFKLILSKRMKDIVDKINKYSSYKKDWKYLKTEKNKKQKFNCVICGSDEIWSSNQDKYKKTGEFYGHNLNTEKLIAYAPSCGSATFEQSITNKKLSEGIKKFDFVFPRDELTKRVSEEIRKEKCQRVVDPTILLLNEWNRFIRPLDIREKYLVYYSYFDEPSMKDNIINFAKEKNLKIISPNFSREWCDINMNISPLEFLWLIKNAEFVVTTTFHGTIFANIFKKNYIVESSGQKVLDFMELIGVNKTKLYRDGMSQEEFSNMITYNLNYDEIFNKLNCCRKESLKLLRNAINE